MLANYLKIALRQLWRNRLFSLLNIVGLTVGLAVSTFIGLYVWHEFHYDHFEPLTNRTYRAVTVSTYGGEDMATLSFHESFATEAADSRSGASRPLDGRDRRSTPAIRRGAPL